MCAAMLRAARTAPRFLAANGEYLLVLGADRGALGVVQSRPVDRAGQAVERELASERASTMALKASSRSRASVAETVISGTTVRVSTR
jgi:hypothetical protein